MGSCRESLEIEGRVSLLRRVFFSIPWPPHPRSAQHADPQIVPETSSPLFPVPFHSSGLLQLKLKVAAAGLVQAPLQSRRSFPPSRRRTNKDSPNRMEKGGPFGAASVISRHAPEKDLCPTLSRVLRSLFSIAREDGLSQDKRAGLCFEGCPRSPISLPRDLRNLAEMESCSNLPSYFLVYYSSEHESPSRPIRPSANDLSLSFDFFRSRAPP